SRSDVFFFTAPPPTEIYTLSLHDALPILKGWTTATDFMQLFAVAQAAPGPNVLITSLIGYRVAGFAGSLVALFAMCLPAAALAWVVSSLWERFRHSPWRSVIQRALAPLVVGLIFAGGYIIATPHSPDWRL